jgi:cell wall-associated NlpC family hydrolase
MRFFTLLCSLLLASVSHAAPAEVPSENGSVSVVQPVIQQIQLAGQHIQFAGEKIQLAGQQLQQTSQTVTTKASKLVVNALGFLGVPYRRGGASAATGFDCSGFVKSVYEETVGLVLPRVAAQQAADTEKISSADLKPGDLVFFNTMRRTFSHVGIYIGDGKFVHSPKSGQEVRIESMSVAYWARRFTGARRVLTGADDNASPVTNPIEEPVIR